MRTGHAELDLATIALGPRTRGIAERRYDASSGILDQSAFGCEPTFRDELSRIFGSAWLFLGPSRWAALPTEYFTSRMGPQPVIVWRGPSGRLHVIVDACPIGQAPLSRSERGRASSFTCRCHGLRFAEDSVARLSPAPGVETIGALLFASWRHDLPFAVAVGEFAPLLGTLAELMIVGDMALRWRMSCNWKLPVEAGCRPMERKTLESGFQLATATGTAAFSEDHLTPGGDEAIQSDAVLAATLFPNLTFDAAASALIAWHPIGPRSTEAHAFCVINTVAASTSTTDCERRFSTLLGIGGSDLPGRMECWSDITRAAARGAGRGVSLNVQAGMFEERRTNLPGVRGPLAGETNARAFYAWWQACLEGRETAARYHPLYDRGEAP
jgi:hypothetical protein